MKKLLVLSAVALAATGAQSVELFNNGPVASGTPAISVIRTGGTLFGAGAQATASNFVAEDFSVGAAGWNVQSLDFFSYQSFAGSAFTFSNVVWSVVSGDVNTGTVVASGTTNVTNGGLQGYRVTATTLTNTDRAIFKLSADVADFSLASGSYWLRWAMAGSLASGPWQPPTSDGVVGNGQQSLGGLTSFAGIVDAGDSLGVSLPFAIQGSVVPEPSTVALMLIGCLGVAGLARRRRQAAA